MYFERTTIEIKDLSVRFSNYQTIADETAWLNIQRKLHILWGQLKKNFMFDKQFYSLFPTIDS